MVTIKLNYEAVTKELNEAESALSSVKLTVPASGDIGRNFLDFTTYFLEREERIHQFINDYVQIVGKNIEDTKANVRSLKDQDEAITRS